MRAVLELAGIHDILSKSLGTQNPINLVKATVRGCAGCARPAEVAELRGLSINKVLGIADQAAEGETLRGHRRMGVRRGQLGAAERLLRGRLLPGCAPPRRRAAQRLRPRRRHCRAEPVEEASA